MTDKDSTDEYTVDNTVKPFLRNLGFAVFAVSVYFENTRVNRDEYESLVALTKYLESKGLKSTKLALHRILHKTALRPEIKKNLVLYHADEVVAQNWAYEHFGYEELKALKNSYNINASSFEAIYRNPSLDGLLLTQLLSHIRQERLDEFLTGLPEHVWTCEGISEILAWIATLPVNRDSYAGYFQILEDHIAKHSRKLLDLDEGIPFSWIARILTPSS